MTRPIDERRMRSHARKWTVEGEGIFNPTVLVSRMAARRNRSTPLPTQTALIKAGQRPRIKSRSVGINGTDEPSSLIVIHEGRPLLLLVWPRWVGRIRRSGRMKVTVVSRSGREVIKGGIELHDEVSFLLLHCSFLLEKKKRLAFGASGEGLSRESGERFLFQ